MNKQKYSTLLIIALYLVLEVVTSKSPYAPEDDAQILLAELRATVLGNIQAARDNFGNFYTDLAGYSSNARSLGEIQIDQVYVEVSQQLTQIKDLAAAANKDISRCTSGREQMINRLPDELKGRLETCVADQNTEASKVLQDSLYLVDITMSKVDQFAFQLRLCGDSALCLTPIVTEIEKDTLKLPELIKVEVNKADELFAELKSLVGQCRDNNVADFTGYVYDLVVQIADCANGIVGRP